MTVTAGRPEGDIPSCRKMREKENKLILFLPSTYIPAGCRFEVWGGKASPIRARSAEDADGHWPVLRCAGPPGCSGSCVMGAGGKGRLFLWSSFLWCMSVRFERTSISNSLCPDCWRECRERPPGSGRFTFPGDRAGAGRCLRDLREVRIRRQIICRSHMVSPWDCQFRGKGNTRRRGVVGRVR